MTREVPERRSAQEVFEDHLRTRKERALEDDALRDYAEGIVRLTGRGVFRGHDGVRELDRTLREELPNADYRYHTALVEGEMAFLEWAARAACHSTGGSARPDFSGAVTEPRALLR